MLDVTPQVHRDGDYLTYLKFYGTCVLSLWNRAVPGKFLAIVGQDPSDSKSNRLHVDIFRFCSFQSFEVCSNPSDSKSNNLHVDIFRFCSFHSFEVCSMDSSQMIGNSPEVSNFNRFICIYPRFFPSSGTETPTTTMFEIPVNFLGNIGMNNRTSFCIGTSLPFACDWRLGVETCYGWTHRYEEWNYYNAM